MPLSDTQPVPTSHFDAIAAGYDRGFTGTAVGRMQRAVVHAFLQDKIGAGTAVLELNCGTGEDAIWLARHGCRVLATDISPEMVARAAEKARETGLNDLIQTSVLDIRDLAPLPPETQYDLILSNFGGLNCLSPEHLKAFGAEILRLLRPGGLFAAVVMGRFCWWESAYFFLKGRPRAAARRWSGGPVPARLDAATEVPTWYYSPAEFQQFFPSLAVHTIQPVGIWLPPSYLDPWFVRHPGWLRGLRGLDALEKKYRGGRWAAAADHFLMVLERR